MSRFVKLEGQSLKGLSVTFHGKAGAKPEDVHKSLEALAKVYNANRWIDGGGITKVDLQDSELTVDYGLGNSKIALNLPEKIMRTVPYIGVRSAERAYVPTDYTAGARMTFKTANAEALEKIAIRLKVHPDLNVFQPTVMSLCVELNHDGIHDSGAPQEFMKALDHLEGGKEMTCTSFSTYDL